MWLYIKCWYGAETWTVTVQQVKALDVAYRILLMALMMSHGADHVRIVGLYGGLPWVTDKVRKRRKRLAWHSLSHTWNWYSKQTDTVGGRLRIHKIHTKKYTHIHSLSSIQLSSRVLRHNYLENMKVPGL